MSSKDASNGDLIIKAINLGEDALPAQLKLADMNLVSNNAPMTVCSSDDLTANNSFQNPTTVLPVKTSVNVAGKNYSHESPAYSLTVLKLKTR